MATGWHIRVGYISGDSCKYDQEQAWQLLKDEVANLREDYKAIVMELYRLFPRTFDEPGWKAIEEIARNYAAANTNACFITVFEPDKQVMLLSTADRELKEHVQRAFVRLVFDAMHKHGIDICLSVV